MTLDSKLDNVDLVNASGKTLTVTQGAAGVNSVEVSGEGSRVYLTNIGENTDGLLQTLKLNGGSLGFYRGEAAEPGVDEGNVAGLTLREGGTLIVGERGGTLEANLHTQAGSILDFTAGAPLTMGCGLEMDNGSVILLAETEFRALKNGKSLTLFEGVELAIHSSNPEGELLKAKVTFQPGESGAGSLAVITPELTTGSLSLLALALLARRRRRH